MLEVADAPELFALVQKNRGYLRQWLPWLDSNTEQSHSEDFIKSTHKQFAEELGFVCGIFSNDLLVGVCGFHPIDRPNLSVTIGYWLGEEYQGKHIVTSCVEFLISYAFQQLNLNKVCIPAAEFNFKSRAVSERLGLANEGIDREAEYLYEHFVNHVRYSILRSEWENR